MLPDIPRQVQKRFDQLSGPYAYSAFSKGKRQTRDQLLWANPQPHERVLDAGCGPGALAWAMSRRAAAACGLDISMGMIRQACLRGRPNSTPIFLVQGELDNLPYCNEAFDLVTCAFCFANLQNPARVLKEFARVLRKTGRIGIIDLIGPEDRTQWEYLNRLEKLRTDLYTRVLRCSDFLALFEKAGLKPKRYKIRRQRQLLRDWLRLGIARKRLTAASRTSVLRKRIVESMRDDQARLGPRWLKDKIVFYYPVAYFLLHKS